MSGGGGRGGQSQQERQKRLEVLQQQVLEEELKERARLDDELDQRRRFSNNLRRLGGRSQLLFRSPEAREAARRAATSRRTTAARPASVRPVASTRSPTRTVREAGGRGPGAPGGGGPGPGADAGGSGGVGCFAAWTPVTMADGTTKPISEIRPGDFISSFDDEGRLCAGRVAATRARDRATVVSLQDGTICTANHRFLTPNAGFVEVASAREGVREHGEARPIRVVGTPPNQAVYNLTIAPHPHYIANGWRVHNIKHEGGFVEGPVEGGDIVEVIQQGEVVMSRDAVKLVGRDFLESLNHRARSRKRKRSG